MTVTTAGEVTATKTKAMVAGKTAALVTVMMMAVTTANKVPATKAKVVAAGTTAALATDRGRGRSYDHGIKVAAAKVEPVTARRTEARATDCGRGRGCDHSNQGHGNIEAVATGTTRGTGWPWLLPWP